MGDLREVRRLVAEVVEEAPSPAPAPPLYPLASSVDAAKLVGTVRVDQRARA